MLRAMLAAAGLRWSRQQTAAAAQDWPARPVTVIVPWAAGGPVDTVARIVAARMSEILGQQLIIENVGGAGGSTGAARAAKAAPDGYTVLLSGSAVLAQNPALYKRQLYNPVTDFEHAALHNDSARVLIARKDFPANNFAEFVAYVKANADKLQYGSPGVGSGGTRLRHPARSGDRRQGHPRAVSRRRPGDAGPARRPPRLHARADFDRGAADPVRHREGVRGARPRSGARPGKPADRGVAGHEGPRLRRLGRVLVSQGHAGSDRPEARQGVERRRSTRRRCASASRRSA